MSYGVRNTLILLIVFALLGGGGFSYIYFIQKSEIDDLQAVHNEKREQYEEMRAVAEKFPVMQTAVERAEDFIGSFDKSLFPTNDPDRIYRFLSELNTDWPRVEFNFVFNDSTTLDQYGIVSSTLTGVGSYRSVYNFINRIENSGPVQKINELVLSPTNEAGEYGNASFSFVLDSYYDRSDSFETSEGDQQVSMQSPARFHNPFYPLIRSIEPNEENLTNVEDSRLIGVGNSRIFLKNQEGRLINLTLNDPVYLGRLQMIDAREGRAVFRLNKGGIIEEITMEVQQ
ncbi:MAG: hypothetical protein WD317_06880 [Balneolaceae bacterium]